MALKQKQEWDNPYQKGLEESSYDIQQQATNPAEYQARLDAQKSGEYIDEDISTKQVNKELGDDELKKRSVDLKKDTIAGEQGVKGGQYGKEEWLKDFNVNRRKLNPMKFKRGELKDFENFEDLKNYVYDIKEMRKNPTFTQEAENEELENLGFKPYKDERTQQIVYPLDELIDELEEFSEEDILDEQGKINQKLLIDAMSE